MTFNARRKSDLYARVGQAMGLTQPSDAHTIAAVRSLLEQIGLKPGLRQHGVQDSQIDALTTQAFADSCHQTNPVAVTREDLARLYWDAM
jgi:alcohol dehydrogenase class IV